MSHIPTRRGIGQNRHTKAENNIKLRHSKDVDKTGGSKPESSKDGPTSASKKPTTSTATSAKRKRPSRTASSSTAPAPLAERDVTDRPKRTTARAVKSKTPSTATAKKKSTAASAVGRRRLPSRPSAGVVRKQESSGESEGVVDDEERDVKRVHHEESQPQERLDTVPEEPEPTTTTTTTTTIDKGKGKQRDDIQSPPPHESTEEEWRLLDEDDMYDPAMVGEYANDIFDYLKARESTYLPLADYMDRQPRLLWQHRLILLDWLVLVFCTLGKLHSEVWFLTVNIIDRFLSRRHVDIAKIQLVGVAALYLAAKFEDTIIPTVETMVTWVYPDLVEAAKEVRNAGEEESEERLAKVESYERLLGQKVHEFTKAEKYILLGLDWDLNYPSPLLFLRRASKADHGDPKPRMVGKYLVELASMDWRLVAVKGSLVASAAMFLGRLICGKVDWTPTLIHYTGYTEDEVVETSNLLVIALLRPHADKWPNLFKRWASSKVGKVAVACKIWARERWPEDSHVDLKADLEALKAYARKQARAAEEWDERRE